jgi:carboxymethylenebutenolidase
MQASADETTSVTRQGRAAPVEIFRPGAAAGGPPWPGVVVIHEIFGANDDMRRIARRFADAGYLAAVPDLFAAGLHLVCLVRAMQALQAGAGPMVDELEAVIGTLEARSDVGRVAAAGFCMGGGFALLLGTRQRVGAAAVFYGDTRPHDELARACPLTGGYGGRDRIFAAKGRELIATLDGLGKEHDIRMYEDAGHSYMSDAGHPVLAWLTRPLMHVEYNAAAAEDSWRRMLAFFDRHLRGATPAKTRIEE